MGGRSHILVAHVVGALELGVLELSDTVIGPLEDDVHRRTAVVAKESVALVGRGEVVHVLTSVGANAREPVGSTIAAGNKIA